MVDTQDLKSCEHCVRTGSSPVRSTKGEIEESLPFAFYSDISIKLRFAKTLLQMQPDKLGKNLIFANSYMI